MNGNVEITKIQEYLHSMSYGHRSRFNTWIMEYPKFKDGTPLTYEELLELSIIIYKTQTNEDKIRNKLNQNGAKRPN